MLLYICKGPQGAAPVVQALTRVYTVVHVMFPISRRGRVSIRRSEAGNRKQLEGAGRGLCFLVARD